MKYFMLVLYIAGWTVLWYAINPLPTGRFWAAVLGVSLICITLIHRA